MGQPLIQHSFAGGEVAPELYAATDNPRYGISLRTCKNFLPTHRGALVNRPGFQLVYGDGLHQFPFSSPFEVSFRLVSFIFSDQSSAVLVFTEGVIYFIVDGRFVETAPASGTRLSVSTPYAGGDLARLGFAQAGDVVTIVHPQHAPSDLVRTGLRSWSIGASQLAPPTGFIAQSLAFAANGFGGDIASAYSGSHNYSTGDYVNDGFATFIAITPNVGKAPSGGGSLTNPLYWQPAIDSLHMVQEQDFVVTVKYKNQFGILLESLPSALLGADMVASTDRPVRFGWAPPANPGFAYKIEGYGIYCGRNGLFGWLDDVDAGTVAYKWDGHAPNFAIQPPQGTNPFAIADGNNTDVTLKYPGVVTYHEQRRVFGRTDVKPNHFMGSRVGDFTNFDVNKVETLDGDSYDWAVASNEFEEIRAAVSLDPLILMTGNGEFTAEGPPGQAITPNFVRIRRNSRHGSSYLPPLTVGNAVVFNTAKGNYIRDLIYSFQVNRLDGVELTLNARHLFDGFTIKAWCYTAVPYPVLWVVRSDGLLLTCTYDRDRGILAWAQHPSFAALIDICSVPEGTEDVVYAMRDYGSARCVERLSSRFVDDLRYAVFLDGAVEFDGHFVGVTGNMTVSGASYDAEDAVTLAGSAVFVTGAGSTDIGDCVVIDPDGLSGGPFRVTINGVVDSSHATGVLEEPLPPLFQNSATSSWAWARDTIPGITTLANRTDVMVLADGSVQGPFTLDGSGKLSGLSPPAVVAQIGVGYVSDAELLDVAPDSIKSKKKSIARVTFSVVASGDFEAGEDFDNLDSTNIRDSDNDFDEPQLVTAPVEVLIGSSWNTGGRACVRQSDPVPLTITAVSRDVVVGGDGG